MVFRRIGRRSARPITWADSSNAAHFSLPSGKMPGKKYHMKNELINEIIKRNKNPAALYNTNDLSFEFSWSCFFLSSSTICYECFLCFFACLVYFHSEILCVSFCLFMHFTWIVFFLSSSNKYTHTERRTNTRTHHQLSAYQQNIPNAYASDLQTKPCH